MIDQSIFSFVNDGGTLMFNVDFTVEISLKVYVGYNIFT